MSFKEVEHTPPSPMKPEGTPTQGQEPKSSSALGRTFQWIIKQNTYIPGISTVTGIFKILGGALVLGGSLLLAGISSCGSLLSIITPYRPLSEKIRNFSAFGFAMVSLGLPTSIREILRGVISAVPVVGNGIVWAADRAVTVKTKDGRTMRDSDVEATADPLLKSILYFKNGKI